MKQVEIKWSKAVIDRLFWKKEKQTLHNQKVLGYGLCHEKVWDKYEKKPQ